MSHVRQTLNHDLTALALLRDELQLQGRLLHGEARDRWLNLEEKRIRLNEHMRLIRLATNKARPDIEEVAAVQARALRHGYATFILALAP